MTAKAKKSDDKVTLYGPHGTVVRVAAEKAAKLRGFSTTKPKS